MKRNIIAVLIALGVIYMGFTACNGNTENADQAEDTTSVLGGLEDSTLSPDSSALAVAMAADTIPYQIAENYFIKNNVKDTVPATITTRAGFENYFGMAAHMGKNGKPTPIDFGKKYVIVVDYPNTKRNIDMQPGLLIKRGADITFNFKINRGPKMRYSIRPFLMIVVDKQYAGNLILHEN